MKRIAPLAIAALLAAGSPALAGPNEALGTILGAAGGGLLGSQIGDGRGQAAATAAGVALGAIIGNSIGRDADRGAGQVRVHDRRHVSPQPAWAGRAAPYYLVEAPPVYQQPRNRCREVAETVYDVRGWPQTVYRTACRRPDGTWQIVR